MQNQSRRSIIEFDRDGVIETEMSVKYALLKANEADCHLNLGYKCMLSRRWR